MRNERVEIRPLQLPVSRAEQAATATDVRSIAVAGEGADPAPATHGGLATVPPQSSSPVVTDALVAETAREIRELSQRALLAFACAVAERVITRFYGGDVSEWRQRGPKTTSIRALADRLQDLEVMSASTLYRYLAGYELLSRMGGVSTLKHATASHVWAVLPLRDSQRQEELFMQAEEGHWTVRELQGRVAATNGRKVKRARRLSSLALAQRVEQGTNELLQSVRSGAGVCNRDGRERLFGAIMRARQALDEAQSLTHPER